MAFHSLSFYTWYSRLRMRPWAWKKVFTSLESYSSLRSWWSHSLLLLSLKRQTSTAIWKQPSSPSHIRRTTCLLAPVDGSLTSVSLQLQLELQMNLPLSVWEWETFKCLAGKDTLILSCTVYNTCPPRRGSDAGKCIVMGNSVLQVGQGCGYIHQAWIKGKDTSYNAHSTKTICLLD